MKWMDKLEVEAMAVVVAEALARALLIPIIPYKVEREALVAVAVVEVSTNLEIQLQQAAVLLEVAGVEVAALLMVLLLLAELI